MKLIIGLGNPGKEYEKTRHNVGFMAVEVLCHQFTVHSNWKYDKKSDAELAKGEIAGEKVILAKPQTFMNNSGQAVKKLVTSYELRVTSLLVIHDDLDLELGTLKLSFGSGSAGHNGVQSIIDALGTKGFWRLRIGIGPKPKSSAFVLCRGQKLSFDAAHFVLKPFSRPEQPKLKKVLAAAADAVQMIFELGPDRAQTEINKT